MADLPSVHEPKRTLTLGRPEHERDEHRVWIAGAARTLLAHFFERDMPSQLAAAVAKDWCDALEGFPQPVIEKARLRWVMEGTRRPTPADIVQLCREEMPRPRVVREPEPERQRVTPEAAAEILAQTGWARRIVKRIPRSGDE